MIWCPERSYCRPSRVFMPSRKNLWPNREEVNCQHQSNSWLCIFTITALIPTSCREGISFFLPHPSVTYVYISVHILSSFHCRHSGLLSSFYFLEQLIPDSTSCNMNLFDEMRSKTIWTRQQHWWDNPLITGSPAGGNAKIKANWETVYVCMYVCIYACTFACLRIRQVMNTLQ